MSMPVSEKNRKLFHGIGLDAIRREVTVGNNYYLPIDEKTQAEAREWIIECEKEIQEAERARVDREKHALQYNFWTLIAAVAAVAIGVVGVLVTLQH